MLYDIIGEPSQFLLFRFAFCSVWSSPIWCWKIGEEEMLSNKGKSPAKEGQLGMIEGECGASTAMMPCLSAPSRGRRSIRMALIEEDKGEGDDFDHHF